MKKILLMVSLFVICFSSMSFANTEVDNNKENSEATESSNSYSFHLPSDEEMLKIHQAELNHMSSKDFFSTNDNFSSRYARSNAQYSHLELIGTYYRSTGHRIIANQPPNGTSSRNGHAIHYKDGNDITANVSFTAGNKYINASIGIGGQIDEATEYSIWIPGGGIRYLATANKTVKFYVYDQYMVSPATGQMSYYGTYTRSELSGIDFDYKKAQ